MRKIKIFLFFCLCFLLSFGISKANILNSQNAVDASFTIPDESYYFGQDKVWTNGSATTTIYGVWVKAFFQDNSFANIVLYDTIDGSGVLATLSCRPEAGHSYSEVGNFFCLCAEYYSVPSQCQVSPYHDIALVVPYTGNNIHATGNVVIYGLSSTNALYGSWWSKATDWRFKVIAPPIPVPNVGDMAFFLLDNIATSTHNTGTDFEPIMPTSKISFISTSTGAFPYPASSTPLNLCANITPPSSVFDVLNSIQWGLCNIAQWLFIPEQISVENYKSLNTTFQQKAPFAYFYAITNALGSLSTTSTPAFILNASSTGALNTSLFQPLKIGLASILWLVFGIWCIKRIAKFDF